MPAPHGHRSSVCDPLCEPFVANGYMAALLGALCSIPIARSMGYAFGWLQEPYRSIVEGDEVRPPCKVHTG
jgi:hypothetical protein